MPMGPPKELEQAIREIIVSPDWSPYFQNFHSGWNFVKEEEYDKLILANHFSLLRYAVVPQNDIFPSREVFEQFFGQFFPYLRPIPQELKKSFLTQIVDRFIELSSFPKGEVHWRIRRLEVVAEKI